MKPWGSCSRHNSGVDVSARCVDQTVSFGGRLLKSERPPFIRKGCASMSLEAYGAKFHESVPLCFDHLCYWYGNGNGTISPSAIMWSKHNGTNICIEVPLCQYVMQSAQNQPFKNTFLSISGILISLTGKVTDICNILRT